MNGFWVIATTILVTSFIAGALIVCSRSPIKRHRYLTALSLPVIGTIAAVLISMSGGDRSPDGQTAQTAERSPVPRVDLRGEFAGSSSCRECHQDQHSTWQRSYHSTMTQSPSADTVRGSFDNVELQRDGDVYLLEHQDDKYWVTMHDLDHEVRILQQGLLGRTDQVRPIVKKQILLITGSHNFQIYWVADEARHGWRQMPWYYFLEEEQWVPGANTLLQPSQFDAMQLVSVGIWNKMCIFCHFVAGEPEQDPSCGRISRHVAELGIACEACHGPAANHVRFRRDAQAGKTSLQPLKSDQDVTDPSNRTPEIASQICGQCHGAFVAVDVAGFNQHGMGYRAGGQIERTHRYLSYDDPQLHESEKDAEMYFWADGTCRVGGDEYNGLIESPCYKQGKDDRRLSCLSCHSMHKYQDRSDQLGRGMEGNRACLNCHSDLSDRIEEHTHHPSQSSGSLCYNCHMPHTSFALLKAIRSHRVDSPDIDSSVRSGRPNACNLCHLDKTMAWSAEHLSDWYGQPMPNFGSDEETVAASVLWMLRGNAIQRAIITWHMGWDTAQDTSGTEWMAPFLSELLLDPYSAVRFVAYRSLRSIPHFDEFQFDFVAPREQRSQRKDRALGIWWETRDAKSFRWGTPLLFEPTGELQHDVFDELLRQRDDRPLSIPE